ncbi:MAG: hypothetical protein IPL61_26450 [Myxococcales bacterium]|nr:hypothetical protein [Myxococcales bacterium]
MARRLLGLGMVLAVAASCGDNRPPEVVVSARGAAWIATRAAPAAPWVRTDGATAVFDADGDGATYDAVIVCRTDVGAGWSLTATYEDGVIWDRPCRADVTGAVDVGFDLGSPADAVFIGEVANHAPATAPTQVPPGTYDVIAVVDDAQGEPTRVELQRGVRIVAGTRVDVDVAAGGVDLVPIAVTVDGGRPDFGSVTFTSAGGTWASLGTAYRVVPAAARADGDLHLVTVFDRDYFAEAPVDEAGIAFEREFVSPDVSFAWTDAPVATWRGAPGHRARLDVVADNLASSPGWFAYAYPAALANQTVEGVTTLVMPAPVVDGWDPAWWPTGPAYIGLGLARGRADGGSAGFTFGEAIVAP